VYVLIRWAVSNDVTLLRRVLPVQREMNAKLRSGWNVARQWYETLALQPPNKPALVFEGNEISFAQMEEQSNRLAHWAISKVCTLIIIN
jgi:non-ribosomal peptide synthetase component F